MSNFKQRTLKLLKEEWGTYIERFDRLPADEKIKRVKEQGFESLRDLLAHVLAWWEEGLEVVLATAAGREPPRKDYDDTAFNAEAVSRYKSWNEAKFFAHFESTRQKMESSLKSMPDAAFENSRIKRWLHGIVIGHAREHIVTLNRALVMDTLGNEWAGYMERFSQLDAEEQKEFLSKQGFETFHDIVAHVIGWFEETLRVVNRIVENPGYVWEGCDVDAYNVELVKKFSAWSERDLSLHYENVRRSLIELVEELPDDAFRNQDIESWLAADVVGHFDGHAL
ncbi:MAG: ClbS/DfsB family four-helix bundle protein [Anaerolineales bacterium]|nr:ClbS/DfsB family four-helix bundle protein [Anaerolineales bacterium]